MIQVSLCLDQVNGCRNGEASSDSGCTLKIELTGFADGKREVQDESRMEKEYKKNTLEPELLRSHHSQLLRKGF